MTCYHAFSRAWRLLPILAWSSDWFIGLAATVHSEKKNQRTTDRCELFFISYFLQQEANERQLADKVLI